MSGPAGTVGAIVLAAGSGQRFGGRKQYAELAPGERLVDRAVAVAVAVADEVVVVVEPGVRWAGPPVSAVGAGGADRSASVAAGLALLSPAVDVVLIHDAAHPLASTELARRVVDAVRAGADGVVPFVEAVDVVKRRRPDGSAETLGRADLGLAQMPMGFRRAALLRARAAADVPAYEDSELVEATGGRVVLIPGEPANLHVVDPATLAIVQRLAAPG